VEALGIAALSEEEDDGDGAAMGGETASGPMAKAVIEDLVGTPINPLELWHK
jgi:hypothetical protein